jgi:DNA polymerase III subunit epsilon
MRQIILDTETTGLQADQGHRIIEIGCLELINRRPTGNTLHLYINPERDIDDGALAVHGLTREFLSVHPTFGKIKDQVLAFVKGAEILIHNANFDVGFLDAELVRVNGPKFASVCGKIVDTVKMARELHPGKRNSLDALCDRYGISNAHRKLHGALLDAELLAEVYLAMTRGQNTLSMLDVDASRDSGTGLNGIAWPPKNLKVIKASEAEHTAHQALLKGMHKEAKGLTVWETIASESSSLNAGLPG